MCHFPLYFYLILRYGRLKYSECIAEYIHTCNTLSFEDCCQKSQVKMTAPLGLFSIFYYPPPPIPCSFLFLCLFSGPLHSLLYYSLPSSLRPPPISPLCCWPSKTECPVLSVCQPKNTNGQKLNFFKLDPLCASHQPPWLLSPNASRSIAATTSSTHHINPGITLKSLGF